MELHLPRVVKSAETTHERAKAPQGVLRANGGSTIETFLTRSLTAAGSLLNDGWRRIHAQIPSQVGKCLPDSDSLLKRRRRAVKESPLLLTIRRSGIFFPLTIWRSGRFMTDKPGDVVQGTLDMLILKTVALEPTHGYGIAVRIEQMSKGVFRVNAGSLFVAIQRLQRDGMIRSEWKNTENSRRAKYYILTERGRKRLNSEKQQWGRQAAAIARILEAS